MAFGSKKTVEVKKASFNERLAGIKSLFSQAYDKASSLSDEMDSQIAVKNSQIAKLQDELGEINKVKDDTESFMKNLEKFI